LFRRKFYSTSHVELLFTILLPYKKYRQQDTFQTNLFAFLLRKARLLYICRSINKEPFTKFVERDIEATMAFLDLFQGGTHKIATNYSKEQLTAMLIRMEGTLRFLLEIENAR
jgi:hypothetical protein